VKRDPLPLLPLSPAMFHVLVALADGQAHGYAILKEVERLTGGEVRLSTGTLYGIIKRLLAEGMGARSRDELAVLLGHVDQRVRMAAQFELADRREEEALAGAALKPGRARRFFTRAVASALRTLVCSPAPANPT